MGLQRVIGGVVVTECFRLLKQAKILDLRAIQRFSIGTVFDAGYERAFARRSFLTKFHALIARPVRPSDELLEYVPTQMVAEFVAHHLGMDGIFYGSAPTIDDDGEFWYLGSEEDLAEYNIVLFGAAEHKHESRRLRRQDPVMLEYVEESARAWRPRRAFHD